MPPFLGRQRWSSFDNTTPFPGAKTLLYVLYMYVLVCWFFCLFVCFLKP